MADQQSFVRVTSAPVAAFQRTGVAGNIVIPASPWQDMSTLEKLEAGFIERSVPGYARRTVAPGMLHLASMIGGVDVACTNLTPTPSVLPVVQVALDGRGTRVDDGVRTLRELSGSITLDGPNTQAVVDLLDAILGEGIPVRAYGRILWPTLTWRLQLEWDDSDDGMIWDGDTLVYAEADITLIENRPVDLLELSGAKPGDAARDAERRAASARTAKKRKKTPSSGSGAGAGGDTT